MSGEVECATGPCRLGARNSRVPHLGHTHCDFAHKPRYGHALSGYRVARTSDVHGRDVLTQCRQCGRIHCYFTGPFFLVLAGVALLYGVGWLPLGAKGWSTLSAALLIWQRGALLRARMDPRPASILVKTVPNGLSPWLLRRAHGASLAHSRTRAGEFRTRMSSSFDEADQTDSHGS